MLSTASSNNRRIFADSPGKALQDSRKGRILVPYFNRVDICCLSFDAEYQCYCFFIYVRLSVQTYKYVRDGIDVF